MPEEALQQTCVTPDRFEVRYTTEDGVERCTPLAEAWAVPLELGRPVRRFTSRKGQRHLSGLWWSASVGGQVGFASWVERDHLMLLDFDSTIVGIVSQSFCCRTRGWSTSTPEWSWPRRGR